MNTAFAFGTRSLFPQILLVGAAMALLGAPGSVAAGPVFAENVKVERVFDGGTFTEGVAVGPDGKIYFVDVTPSAFGGNSLGHVMRFDPITGTTVIYRSPSGQANGMKFDASGHMIVVEGADGGGRRVTRTDLVTGKSELVAAAFGGQPFNSLNDVAIDGKGRIYVTDPRYIGKEPIHQPVYGVYRIDLNGRVDLLIADINKPNGIAFAPDFRTLYVAEHFIGTNDIPSLPKGAKPTYGPMRVLAYEVKENGSVALRRVIADYGDKDGPDGLITDAEGNIYVAARAEPDFGIRVYAPDGREIDFIRLPVKPTNIAFGRDKASNVLYITAGTGLYRVTTKTHGWLLKKPEEAKQQKSHRR